MGVTASLRSWILVLPLVIFGCADGALTGPWNAESDWRLVAIEPEGSTPDLAALAIAPTIRFTPEASRFGHGAVSGYSGCNSFSGRYALGPSGGITLTEMESTLVGCAPPAGEIQLAYYDRLDRVARYRMRADTLVLETAERERLRFVPQ